MNIQKFRKKPVVVEAVQITPDNLSEVALWCSSSVGEIAFHTDGHSITVLTLEGRMRAEVGDWVIKGIKGEFYPCKNDIFELTYERLDN